MQSNFDKQKALAHTRNFFFVAAPKFFEKYLFPNSPFLAVLIIGFISLSVYNQQIYRRIEYLHLISYIVGLGILIQYVLIILWNLSDFDLKFSIFNHKISLMSRLFDNFSRFVAPISIACAMILGFSSTKTNTSFSFILYAFVSICLITSLLRYIFLKSEKNKREERGGDVT